MRKKTGWKCERCGNAGVVRYPENADVYAVIGFIEDAHNDASIGSCVLDLCAIRVWPVPPAPAAVLSSTEGTP